MANWDFRRKHGKTLAEAAYAIIKCAPASTVTLAAELQVSRGAATEAARRLRADGCIQAERRHGGCVWVALKPPKKDRRGTSKASKKALKDNWRVTPQHYININRHPKVRPSTELERAWGWGVAYVPSPYLRPPET